MAEFWNQLTSPSWWISVVIVGIIINIISAPLEHLFENQLAKISDWQRRKSQEKAETYQKLLETLKTNESKQLLYAIQEQRFRIRSFANMVVLYIAMGGMFFFEEFIQSRIGSVVAILLGLFGLLAGFASLSDAKRAIEVKRTVKKLNPDIFAD